MTISPLDIQNYQFRIRFRGFDVQEVDNFIEDLSKKFSELLKENQDLQKEINEKEERIREVRGLENTLKETIESVGRLAEELKNNAKREAQIIISEAQMEAQKILGNARAHITKIQDEIMELRTQKIQFEAELEKIIEIHSKMLDELKSRGRGEDL